MNAPMTTLPAAEMGRVAILKQLERKLLWLSAWMIHNANHIRPNRDGLKVGGHQASCASSISILTALYFEIARPQDRIAVKPHAGPVAAPAGWRNDALAVVIGVAAWFVFARVLHPWLIGVAVWPGQA